jgi:hypothetical protein
VHRVLKFHHVMRREHFDPPAGLPSFGANAVAGPVRAMKTINQKGKGKTE